MFDILVLLLLVLRTINDDNVSISLCIFDRKLWNRKMGKDKNFNGNFLKILNEVKN